MKKLGEVLDPEIGLSIVDLGFIYDIKIHNDKSLNITMTLTTMGCPLFPIIEQDIKSKMAELGFRDEQLKITLTFDPPWTVDRLSKKGKATLGI